MKFWIACFYILSISLAIFVQDVQAQPQPQTKPEAQDSPKRTAADSSRRTETGTDEFPKLLSEYYAAWSTKDPSAAAKFYAKEPDLVFYDVAPLKYTGWKDYQAGASKTIQDFANFRLTSNRDLVVTRKGKIAWTTATVHVFIQEKDGTALELDCRHTAIWEKRKGKWLIVHEHTSAPLPQL